MKGLTRLLMLALLYCLAALSLPNEPLAAQGTDEPGSQAPESFVPSEKLPAGSAVSFPVDI